MTTIPLEETTITAHLELTKKSGGRTAAQRLIELLGDAETDYGWKITRRPIGSGDIQFVVDIPNPDKTDILRPYFRAQIGIRDGVLYDVAKATQDEAAFDIINGYIPNTVSYNNQDRPQH